MQASPGQLVIVGAFNSSHNGLLPSQPPMARHGSNPLLPCRIIHTSTAWEPSWCAAQRFVRQKRRKILCEPSLNLEQLMVSKLRWKCFKWQGHKLPMFANMWIARHVQLPVVWARPWKMSNVHLLCRKHFRKCNVAKVSVESCRCSVLHTPDLFKDNRVSQLWAQHFKWDLSF